MRRHPLFQIGLDPKDLRAVQCAQAAVGFLYIYRVNESHARVLLSQPVPVLDLPTLQSFRDRFSPGEYEVIGRSEDSALIVNRVHFELTEQGVFRSCSTIHFSH